MSWRCATRLALAALSARFVDPLPAWRSVERFNTLPLTCLRIPLGVIRALCASTELSCRLGLRFAQASGCSRPSTAKIRDVALLSRIRRRGVYCRLFQNIFNWLIESNSTMTTRAGCGAPSRRSVLPPRKGAVHRTA